MNKGVGPLNLTGTLPRWTSTERYQKAVDDITQNSGSLKRRWYITDTSKWGFHGTYGKGHQALIRTTVRYTHIHIIRVSTLTVGTITKVEHTFFAFLLSLLIWPCLACPRRGISTVNCVNKSALPTLVAGCRQYIRTWSVPFLNESRAFHINYVNECAYPDQYVGHQQTSGCKMANSLRIT